jgi:hypothetical protein
MLLKGGLPTAALTATTTATAITVATTATAIIVTAATTTTTATTISAAAAAAIATTTTAAAAAATATATAAILLGTTLFGFVHTEIAALKVRSVHFFDCFTSKIIVCESDESKSAWAVCLTIERDEEVFDCSVSSESFADVLV